MGRLADMSRASPTAVQTCTTSTATVHTCTTGTAAMETTSMETAGERLTWDNGCGDKEDGCKANQHLTQHWSFSFENSNSSLSWLGRSKRPAARASGV